MTSREFVQPVQKRMTTLVQELTAVCEWHIRICDPRKETAMTPMWGIHNDTFDATELVAKGFVSIGWDATKDLRVVGDDQPAMRAHLSSVYPAMKAGAVPVTAGVLRRFAFVAQEGDWVVAPNKKASTLNFGRLAGPYEYHPDASTHRHRRKVTWIQTEVPRSTFSQPALYVVGSAVTMFRVSNHSQEFLAHVTGSPSMPLPPNDDVTAATDDDTAVAKAEEEPSAAKMEQYTRDFVAKCLYELLTAEEFEHFTADLLRAMGYRARVTQHVADGGVDVLVHKDALGLDPGLIKVQCKQTLSSHGTSDVNQLAGTLGKDEAGLFVTLGSFTSSAMAIERQLSDLRLMPGAELVELTLEHFDELPARWRARMPLRKVFVVDRDSEGY